MNNKCLVYINGKVVTKEEAKISVFDRGFLYGDALFETIRGYNEIPFMIDKHLDRLFNSAKKLKIQIPLFEYEIKGILDDMLKEIDCSHTYIRITITRGEGDVGIDPTSCKRSNIIMIVKEYHPYPKEVYQRGFYAKIVSTRCNEHSPVSRIKSSNFLNNIFAKLEVKRKKVDEGIILNTEGFVAEGTVSNIFMVKGKEILTPSIECGILPGITRFVVIEIARKLNWNVREEKILPEELLSCNECFITNSLIEIMPIVKINNRIIGEGKPGKLTKTLRQRYIKLTSNQHRLPLQKGRLHKIYPVKAKGTPVSKIILEDRR